jgi:hypothetical protein
MITTPVQDILPGLDILRFDLEQLELEWATRQAEADGHYLESERWDGRSEAIRECRNELWPLLAVLRKVVGEFADGRDVASGREKAATAAREEDQ